MSVTGYVNNSNQKDFVLTTYDKINVSTGQPKFTFSKADRFPKIKTNCPVTSYDMPGQLSNRSAAMGYGMKMDFSGKNRKSLSLLFASDPYSRNTWSLRVHFLTLFVHRRIPVTRQIQTHLAIRLHD